MSVFYEKKNRLRSFCQTKDIINIPS